SAGCRARAYTNHASTGPVRGRHGAATRFRGRAPAYPSISTDPHRAIVRAGPALRSTAAVVALYRLPSSERNFPQPALQGPSDSDAGGAAVLTVGSPRWLRLE